MPQHSNAKCRCIRPGRSFPSRRAEGLINQRVLAVPCCLFSPHPTPPRAHAHTQMHTHLACHVDVHPQKKDGGRGAVIPLRGDWEQHRDGRVVAVAAAGVREHVRGLRAGLRLLACEADANVVAAKARGVVCLQLAVGGCGGCARLFGGWVVGREGRGRGAGAVRAGTSRGCRGALPLPAHSWPP